MIARFIALAIGLATPAAADPAASVRLLWQDGAAQVQVSKSGLDAESVFAIASVGKTMTAVVILSLVDEGVLTLDTEAAQWLPADVVAGLGGLQGISLRHLLSMQSGLPDYYTYNYMMDALENPDTVQQPRVALSYIYGEPTQFAPGRRFDYSNTNYVLLGLIAEQASGRSYADLMQDRVFIPSGMTDSYVFGAQALPDNFVPGLDGRTEVRGYYEGTGFGDGGVVGSALDLARFYDALFFDQTLLSSKALQALMHDPEGDQYGLGIVTDGKIVSHAGADIGFSSEVAANLETNTIAVMLVAEDGASTDWVLDQVLN